jgi:glycosyltransferase 2 family protein
VKRSARYRLIFLGRLVITSVLIALVAVRFDLDAIKRQMLSVGSATLLAAGIVVVVQMLVRGYRWQRILDASGIAVPFCSALRIVIIGLSFNQCLPTSLGGDGVRAFMLRSANVRLERAVNAVLVDRLSGLAGLLPFSSRRAVLVWPGARPGPPSKEFAVTAPTINLRYRSPFALERAVLG